MKNILWIKISFVIIQYFKATLLLLTVTLLGRSRPFGIQIIYREHHSLGWLHFCWQSIKYTVSGSPILQDEEQSNPLAPLHLTLVFRQVWRWVPKHPFSATAGGGVDHGCLKFFQRWECFWQQERCWRLPDKGLVATASTFSKVSTEKPFLYL